MTAHSFRFVRAAAAALGFSLLAGELPAHGGQYRGPNSVTPSGNSSGGGGSASGPSGGGAPSAGGGATSSPSGPAAPPGPAPSGAATGSGAGRPRGIQLDDDLGRWEYWWEFGKDPWIRLRDAIRSADSGGDDFRPGRSIARDLALLTSADVEQRVQPALKDALDSASDRDTVSGCIVALAKIGRDHADWKLHDVFAAKLRSHDQEIRETAALAFGIAGLQARHSVDLVVALAADRAEGRKACDRATVDERTRAFATYAAGLLLRRAEPATARQIVPVLAAQLVDATAGRNVRVAAIESLALLAETSDTAIGALLRDDAVRALGDYYKAALGPGEQLVQAHCPTVIARLLGRAHPRAAEFEDLFAADLAAELPGRAVASTGRVNPHVGQSCALALGLLCKPWDDGASEDATRCELLVRAARGHRDRQVRAFSVIALGRIGGKQAKAFLLGELEGSNRHLELPWIALALGVGEGRRFATLEAEGRSADPDPTVCAPLRAAFADLKNPSAVGAVAIGIGLCRDLEAADLLREALEKNTNRDDVAGHLCIALALLKDDRARKPILDLLHRSVRRPSVLLQAATALGRLGDRAVSEDLCKLLQSGDASLARLSALASALGQIGDRRSLDPLLKMLKDPGLTPLTRAFAAVALGSVADRELLPWNAAFAAGTNYRAAVETLTDGAAGILDIL